ncbi:hypothetical protein ACFO0J_08030 [Castellaniella hirudinis]|uniref:Uncharacterized protein n=1 Tax=Castellaniella hirudinis TaxID=1144617 RepID=A0ABV8RXL2_9BURK
MNTRTLALVGLLSLGIQTCNIAQAQYTLSREDAKSLRVTHGDSSPNGAARGVLQAPQDRSARDSEFSEKFNKALSDVKRKEQEAQAQSLRTQMQNQDMLNSNVHSPHRSDTTAPKGRTEIRFDKRGTTACGKTESGQTRCETQGQW